jgi:hypothetical protein
VCMSRIRLAPGESPRRRHAYEQRQQRLTIISELVACWRYRHDDPFMVEVLRGLALAQSLDYSHPIDRHGRCKRWRCTRHWWWFPFTRRPCPTRVTLSYCRSADTVTLWFALLNQLPNVHLSLATVRGWLEQCHTSKPPTDEPATARSRQSHISAACEGYDGSEGVPHGPGKVVINLS